LAHPASALNSEAREAQIVEALRAQGHDARIYRSSRPGSAPRPKDFQTDPVLFFDIDPDEPDAHRSTSSSLIAQIVEDRPEILIVKGLGYRLTTMALKACQDFAVLGAIIGGSAQEPEVNGLLDFMLAEYEGQVSPEFCKAHDVGLVRILPKWIDWDTIRSLPEEAPKFDIINVGNFSESRKNQEYLFPLMRKNRMCLVGGGSRLEHFAALTKDYSNVFYPGVVKNTAVLGLVKSSRLMVHTSVYEGFPRAIAESLACGTPVLALAEGVQGGFGEGDWGWRCVGTELLTRAESLLNTPELLDELSVSARNYATKMFSFDATMEVVQEAISFAVQKRVSVNA
jgi:glycosyltransferase involved in cell wall biosynthesis